ncbi:MAG TPA: FHA domain-containing protein [Polyangiaceae bacterium]|nr:FHA domain-containing protein [Polyangiaceae bacterium]
MTAAITIEVRCAGTGSAVTYEFRRLPITIGRDEDNDVSIGRRFVSARHARIEEMDGRLRVVDLNSTNGVSVRGADGRWTRLPNQAAYDLEASGFEFGVGQYALRVRWPRRAGFREP